MGICKTCRRNLTGVQKVYCSNKCQKNYEYKSYIKRWYSGLESGLRGINTLALSQHIIRYILNKYNNQCAKCGWHEINETLGHTPLEIDHIDGNSLNNNENNLILLCPNCHSLTSNYRNLNKGNGRVWRREKYVKIV